MTDRTSVRTQLIRMFVGALLGLAISAAAAKSGFLEWAATMPAEDVASTIVASIMLFLGAFALVASASPGVYRRIAANYREGDPLDAGVLRMVRLSATAMLLSAALLAAPPFAVRLGVDGSAARIVAGAVGVLLLASSWLGWRVLRTSDELTRALARETSEASFWVLSIGLFGWASLVKLGLAQEVSMWTLMTITMAVSLVVQIGFAMRRGMFA